MNKIIMESLSFYRQLTLPNCVFMFLLLSFSQITYAGKVYTKIDADGYELTDDAAGWSCVKHNITGQIWEVKTEVNISDIYTFGETPDYVDLVNSNNLCGYQDWRLPTIKELNSITDKTRYNPGINTSYFPITMVSYPPNIMPLRYWSASINMQFSSTEWTVDFYRSEVASLMKTSSGYIRLVRGEQYFDFFDYTKLDSNGNDLPDNAIEWSCVRDNSNGLIWEVKTTHNKDLRYTLNEAIEYANQTNSQELCGFTDWRVPEIDELTSIVHYTYYSPAIETAYFPYTVTSSTGYNSVTPYIGGDDPESTWAVKFGSGSTFYGYDEDYIRLVRTEQSNDFLSSIYFLIF